jgi:histone-lysine N-methyltransferase SETD7
MWIGQYVGGLPSGYIWKMLEGGGWLHGRVDHNGKLTGDDIMYIYPDLNTCLVGRFTDGVMEATKEAHVERFRWVDNILVVEVGETTGPDFSFSPSTSEYMTVNWLQQDPYERDRVECLTSHIEGAGVGLFFKRNLPAGTYVSFYHGLYFQLGKMSPEPTCSYQIFLDWDKAPHSEYLDLMPEAWSHKQYCATLGHKVNHSFSPNCEFAKFQHPRFGKTALAIRTLVDVKEGDELTCNYKYDCNDAPIWYTDIYGFGQGGENTWVKHELDSFKADIPPECCIPPYKIFL